MQHIASIGPAAGKRVNVIQGTSYVTADPEMVLTTVLGSCVACCLYEPDPKVPPETFLAGRIAPYLTKNGCFTVPSPGGQTGICAGPGLSNRAL